jgi:kynurenine formamidase
MTLPRIWATLMGRRNSRCEPTSKELRDGLRTMSSSCRFNPGRSGTRFPVYYEGKLFNGYASATVTSRGAAHNSNARVAVRGAVTRGVLIDVAAHRGVRWLEPGYAITAAELDEVLREEGLSVAPGDIVLVRTGWWERFATENDSNLLSHGSPGLHWRCVEWLHDRQVAAVASDNVAVEASPHEEGARSAFHMIALRDMGLTLGELWDLGRLSADCAGDRRYEFMLSAPPLHFVGAVGSPLNPLAVK